MKPDGGGYTPSAWCDLPTLDFWDRQFITISDEGGRKNRDYRKTARNGLMKIAST